MSRHPRLIIERLNNEHNKAAFECGEISLNNYLKKQAKQDVKRRISQVFVALDHVLEQDAPATVIGYYTLSSLPIDVRQLPQNQLKKLPKVPIPAALIGRLAVSKQAQGEGVGKMLLVDAIKRTLSVSEQVAIYALVVDAIDDVAGKFYQKLGFLKLNTAGSRLFLPLKSLL